MLEFSRDGENFIVKDPAQKISIILDRVGARALARFFMVELNVIEATIQVTPESQKLLSEIDSRFKQMLIQRRGF